MSDKLNSVDLMHMWLEEGLKQEDIEAKLRSYIESDCRYIYPSGLDEEVIWQVARCIHHIYEHYHKWNQPGQFLMALATNNFDKIMDYADSENKRAIYLYRLYLYNCAPGNWREKLRGD